MRISSCGLESLVPFHAIWFRDTDVPMFQWFVGDADAFLWFPLLLRGTSYKLCCICLENYKFLSFACVSLSCI